MSEKRRILICYASKDDTPVEGHANGWVSTFAENLTKTYQKVSDKELTLDLQSDQDLVANSKLDVADGVIAVLSGNFFQSQLLVDFLKDAQDKVSTKHQFIGVFIEPIAYFDQWLPDAKFRPINMYAFDFLTNNIIRFEHDNKEFNQGEYWLKLLDISSALQFKDDSFLYKSSKRKKNKYIYLAQTGKDLIAEGELISRELRRRGFHVLPETKLPESHDAFVNTVNDNLERSMASIHLIGEDYGDFLEGTDRSVIDLENHLAAIHADQQSGSDTHFKRIVWISPMNEHTSVKQKIFIENLKKDAHAVEHAEVIQNQIDELKFYIRKFLEKREGLVSASDSIFVIDPANQQSKSVYVIADNPESEGLQVFTEILKEQGCQVIHSIVSKDVHRDRDVYVHNLKCCDAAVIYYSTENGDWVRSRHKDMLKYISLGRKKPLRLQAIVSESDEQIKNINFGEETDTLFLEKEHIHKELLQPLLDKIQN